MALKHVVLAVLVAVVWGINFVAIDLGLRDTPPLVLVALRFALVAVPLIFFVRRPAVPWRTIVGVGLFVSAGQFGLLFTAMHLGLPAGLAAVVLQCQMIFTLVVAAVALRERPTGRQIAGATIGFAGLGMVALGRLEGAEGAAALLPLLICVAAGLSWGIGNVVARSAGPSNGFGMVVWSAAVVPAPILALSLLLDGPAAVGEALTTIGWPTVLSLAYTVVLASLFGYTVWYSLLGRYPAALVAPFALLAPPVGLLSAAIVLGERPNPLELGGSALLVGGVALGQLTRRARGIRPAGLADAPDERISSPHVPEHPRPPQLRAGGHR
ncbi:EamA family transporter [Agromyces silvae]|uniref:EamA family transporter n=1 Tax=Agromyces silvae TaxID=3388266 RepID=UPI00280C2797|nr:EamA family transporter [Agromyces protaetiae]